MFCSNLFTSSDSNWQIPPSDSNFTKPQHSWFTLVGLINLNTLMYSCFTASKVPSSPRYEKNPRVLRAYTKHFSSLQLQNWPLHSRDYAFQLLPKFSNTYLFSRSLIFSLRGATAWNKGITFNLWRTRFISQNVHIGSYFGAKIMVNSFLWRVSLKILQKTCILKHSLCQKILEPFSPKTISPITMQNSLQLKTLQGWVP